MPQGRSRSLETEAAGLTVDISIALSFQMQVTSEGFAQKVLFAEDISRAKAQSAAAFSEVFFAPLRLCAGKILATDAP